ncbi:hypothetical protein ACW9KT_19530 [Hymenobacter sp. HD11105]
MIRFQVAGRAHRPQPAVLPQWLLEKMVSEMASIRAQLRQKADYYAGIRPQHIETGVGLVAGMLWQLLLPESLVATLTYEQSLHVRAELPAGAGSVHVSVLFSPGLDPTQNTGQQEEEDNTLVSVYDAHGQLRGGTEGPLLDTLNRLHDVLTQATGSLVSVRHFV